MLRYQGNRYVSLLKCCKSSYYSMLYIYCQDVSFTCFFFSIYMQDDAIFPSNNYCSNLFLLISLALLIDKSQDEIMISFLLTLILIDILLIKYFLQHFFNPLLLVVMLNKKKQGGTP